MNPRAEEDLMCAKIGAEIDRLKEENRKMREALECSRDMRKHFIASNTTDLEICRRFDKAIMELDDES